MITCKQRGDEAQITRDGRLQGEQREDALVDLQVAPVEAVVVGDHHLRELDVLVSERLHHAVELLDDQIQAAERAVLQLLQLLLEVGATLLERAGAAPSSGPPKTARRPGASAELSGDIFLGSGVDGVVKISSVGPTSTSWPPSMKAVRSATRAACCMLWVTITIVTRDLSWSISSSILSVAIGSSAEQGSSIRITSGSTASERAMHSRCC